MKLGSAFALLLAVAACGKGDKSDKPEVAETETVALGTSGMVVEVPEGWTVDIPMAGFYDFKGARGTPQIMESAGDPSSLDDAVKLHCDGRPDIQKGTLAGGYWLACKGESKMVKGVQTTQIMVEVKGDTKTFSCLLETDKDPATVLGVCKSLRKKT